MIFKGGVERKDLFSVRNWFRQNKFFSNTIWIISGKIFQMALQLVVGMITARYLGPSNYGVIGYTASYISFFSSISNLGFNSIAVKELLDKPQEQGKCLGTMIVFRIFSSVLSSGIIIMLVYILDAGDPLIMKVAFLQSLALVFQSFEMITYWYQSRLEAKVSVKIETIAYIVVACYKIVILVMQKNVAWFAFTTALDSLVIAVFLLISYYPRKKQKFAFAFQRGIELLQKSYHFIISGLMVAIYSQMDRIMLKQMLDEYTVGLYSAAMNISSMWGFVLAALINSAQPVIIASKEKDNHLYIKQIKRLYAAIIWIGILFAGGISIFSKFLIGTMYGKSYLPAAGTLTISVWYEIFAMLGTARGIWCMCEEKVKYIKYFLGIGAVINIALNYYMIPVYGSSGAAIATLITQFVAAVIAPVLFKETRIHTKYVIEAFLLKGIYDK